MNRFNRRLFKLSWLFQNIEDMHVKNSKNILTLIIGGRLKSENSFEPFSLIIIKLNWILIITIL